MRINSVMEEIGVSLSTLEPDWKANIGEIELHLDDVRSLGFCRSPIGYLNDKVIDALVYALQRHIPESFLVEEISLVLVTSLMTSNFEGVSLEDRIKFLRRGKRKTIDDRTQSILSPHRR